MLHEHVFSYFGAPASPA